MGIFKKIKRAITGAIKSIVNVVMKVVSLVSMPFGKPFGGLDGQAQSESFINEVKVNKESGVANVPIVYGRRRIGGTRVYVGVQSGNSNFLTTITTLTYGAGYPGVNGFYKIYIDEKEVPLRHYSGPLQPGYVTGSFRNNPGAASQGGNFPQTPFTMIPSSGPYQNRVEIQLALNSYSDASLRNFELIPPLTSRHHAVGFSHLICRFQWLPITNQAEAEANPYGRGIPQVEIEVQGRPIIDLLGYTLNEMIAFAGGPGILRDRGWGVTNQDNPVNVLYDYMRQGNSFNPLIAQTDIDAESWYKAAYQCSQVVNGRKAFTFNGVIDTGKSHMDNIKIILEHFRGLLTYRNGKYFLKIENAGDDDDITNIPADMAPYSVMTLDQDVLIGGLKIQGDTVESKFNEVRVTFVDPSANFNATDVYYPTGFVASYRTEDQQKRLEKKVSLEACTNRDEAYHYGQVALLRSRNQMSIEAKCTMAAANLAVGDIVRVNNPAVAIDKFCRVYGVKLTPEATVELTLIEHYAEAYTFDQVASEPDRPAFVSIDPFTIQPPTNAQISFLQNPVTFDGKQGFRDITISWTKSTSTSAALYRVFRRYGGDNQLLTTTSNNVFVHQRQPIGGGGGYAYNYMIDAVNAAHTVKSAGVFVSQVITTEYQPSSGASSVINTGGTVQSVGPSQFGA